MIVNRWCQTCNRFVTVRLWLGRWEGRHRHTEDKEPYMNKHVGNPVVYTGDFREEIKNAFGMRLEIYRKTMGYIFDNRLAGLKGKHHAHR